MIHEPKLPQEPVQAREPRALPPQTIGKAGEIATEASFTPSIPQNRRESIVLDYLTRLGVVVDERLKKLVKETLEGLDVVKPLVEEEYGSLSIIGKGETRYGMAPTYGMPDYVAFASGKDKPILVEVKNTERLSSQDEFQASYYNTLQSTVGVVVTSKRIEEGETTIRPKVVLERDAETLIVYPRLGDHIPITDTLDMSNDLVRSIWEAKQLGLVGKMPERKCPEKCPHRRYDVELPEGTLEVAKPVPLIFARGLVEAGTDLDFSYLRSFAWENAFPLMDASFLLRGEMDPTKEKRLIDLLSSRIEISENEARRLVRRDFGKVPFPHEIRGGMASELEAWQKLVGTKGVEEFVQKSAGLATRIYTIPKGSEEMIRKSWHKWVGRDQVRNRFH